MFRLRLRRNGVVMENKGNISGIMGITMEKLKEMVDVNTIVGLSLIHI